MEFDSNQQISSHNQNSTTVWTQPKTDEQRRYYSKHAGEKRVFGWITTVFQGAHGFLAFAAWTAIYVWIFQAVPFLMPVAPILSAVTLMAMHVLFRTTWETYWYDRLDDDPVTDSPVWVPIIIIVLLLIAEVNGMQQFLAGQIKPAEKQGTEQIDQSHTTTLSAYEQSWANEKADIENIYKQKERAAAAQYDRRIRNLSVSDGAEKKRQLASLRAQRDAAIQPIVAAKAAALEKALSIHQNNKNSEFNRRNTLVAQVDSSNTREDMRVQSELGNVGTYSWLISVVLLLIISALSYRTVKINVESGILPLRNYTVLDAHGSLPERIWTALSDAINRRGLQFAVWLHRILSPKSAIRTFDGTVVAEAGTYNTPEGFHQADDQKIRNKVALKIMQEAATKGLTIDQQTLDLELDKARRMNGSYMSSEFGKKAEASPSTARTAEATPTPSAPALQKDSNYSDDIQNWKRRVGAQLDMYDKHYVGGQLTAAKEIQDYVFFNPDSPIVKEGNRLNLEWGVKDGIFQVRRRDRSHFIPLDDLSGSALDTPPSRKPSPEEDDLFKQDIKLFKQKIIAHKDEHGNVIGVKYLKRDNTWTTYDFNTVRGQLGIYQKRAEKEGASATVTDGVEKWTYALSLFEDSAIGKENLQPVLL